MTAAQERRRYDVLRLLADHGPVGSVHLTDSLRERGYSITERTVRLVLADLDEAGLTEKVDGKGRRLTAAGRAELERGVTGRVERVSERLAALKSQVTYDPETDAGDVVVGTVVVPRTERGTLTDLLGALDDSPIGPIVANVDTTEHDGEECLEVAVPSSVTVDGVLLGNGIDSHPDTIGVVEYHPDPESVPYDDPNPAANGGAIRRFIDVIGDERATLDLGALLMESGRTDVTSALHGDTGLLVADNREFPVTRYDDGRDLAEATRDALGGVLDVRRPRESGPFPWDTPGWSHASLTYVGASECVVAACIEAAIAREWDTLTETRPRSALSAVGAAAPLEP